MMYSVIHIPLTSAGGLLRRLGARCQSPAQPIPTLLMRGSHDPIVNIKEEHVGEYTTAFGQALEVVLG